MRWPRFRFSMRFIMALVALVAVLLGSGLGVVRFRRRMAAWSTIYQYTSASHALTEAGYRAMQVEALGRAEALDRLGAPKAADESRRRANRVTRWAEHEARLKRTYAAAEAAPWWSPPAEPPEPPPVWPRLAPSEDIRGAIEHLHRRLGE